MDGAQTNRSHRERRSGAKVNKKKAAARSKHADGNKSSGTHNPRAFTVKSRVKAARAVQRNLDRAHQKEKVAHVNRTPDVDPPPIVVAVMGPPGVGKTKIDDSFDVSDHI